MSEIRLAVVLAWLLRKELALALYQRRVLPMAKAARLAQMSRWE